jgi:hypothetical protein
MVNRTVRGDEQEQVLRVRVYSKGMMGKAIVGTGNYFPRNYLCHVLLRLVLTCCILRHIAIIPIDALISTSMASATQTGRLRAVSAAPPSTITSTNTNTVPTTPSRASTQVGPKAFPVTPAGGNRSLGKAFDASDSKSFEDDDL